MSVGVHPAVADEPDGKWSKAQLSDRHLHGRAICSAWCGARAGAKSVSTHHACMPVDRIRPPVGALHQHLRHDRFLHALRPQRSAAPSHAPSHAQPAAVQELPSLLAAVDRRAAPLRNCCAAARNHARLSQACFKAVMLRVSSVCRTRGGAPGPRRPCR